MIMMPRTVILRNDTKAVIDGLTRIGAERADTMLQGRRVDSVHIDLWLTTGRWSYTETDHPLDIVKLITSKGAIVAFGQEVLQ